MRQAEVVAMRALSDQLAMLNKGIDNLHGDMRGFREDLVEVRERLIAMESSKVEARLEREVVRLESAQREAATDRRRIEDGLNAEIERVNGHIADMRSHISVTTGKLLPIGALGLIVITGVVSYLVKVL